MLKPATPRPPQEALPDCQCLVCVYREMIEVICRSVEDHPSRTDGDVDKSIG